eukprot:6360297-Amphidinium_carterae.1
MPVEKQAKYSLPKPYIRSLTEAGRGGVWQLKVLMGVVTKSCDRSSSVKTILTRVRKMRYMPCLSTMPWRPRVNTFIAQERRPPPNNTSERG